VQYVSICEGDFQLDSRQDEEIAAQAEKIDQWNFYQSKGTKGHLAELAARLTKEPAQVEFYKKEIGRYDLEKKEIRVKAEDLDKESHRLNEKSDHALHPLHKLEQEGWITAEWKDSDLGRSAKFYALTREGKKQLERELRSWERLSSAVQLLIESA
jgi:DNA-binding MarR family transcriptional regulator